MFKDDSDFEEVLADIATYRNELDEEYYHKIDAKDWTVEKLHS